MSALQLLRWEISAHHSIIANIIYIAITVPHSTPAVSRHRGVAASAAVSPGGLPRSAHASRGAWRGQADGAEGLRM
eukprot:5533236-Pyramimonas_sp.AAC.1